MTTSTPSKLLTTLLLTVPVALACDTQGKQIGQLDDSTDNGGTADSGDTDDTGYTEDTPDTGDTEDTGAEQDSAACVTAIESLLALFEAQQGQHCALVVLFDFETHAPSGWHLQCDVGDLGMNVDTARALTSWGGDDISEPNNEPSDDRSFLFYTAPTDTGGVGWVSNHVGLMFDASIVAGGVGAIQHPESFGNAGDLGTGCIAPDIGLEWRGYDLTIEPVVYGVPHVAEVWAAIVDTAVLRAVLLDADGSDYTLDALTYPRTMADFKPSNADYVVVLEWER